jgi:hypothetical protein
MTMELRTIKTQLVRNVRTLVTRNVADQINDSMLLQGRMASWHVRSLQSIESLQDAEFKVFSQWGQDGIIDWLIERVALPPRLHTFVEFGVGDYSEANTRFLLENRNWRGLIIDGDPALADLPIRDPRHHRFDLTTKSAFIYRDNINDLFSDAAFTGEIGLLSVDIDGNDYWVWEAIDVVQPVIVICEFNSTFGDLHPVSVPYDPQFVCGVTQPNRLYYGASLPALSALATRKGYRLLGTTMVGNDVFFIREDYAPRLDSTLKNIVAHPSKCPMPMDMDGTGKFKWFSGLDRLKSIATLPLINTETGKTVTLAELGDVYSDDWLQQTTPSLSR